MLGSGTSQGVPVIGCECETYLSDNPKDKRLRASVFIETEDSKIMIDTSIDFRQQVLRAGINDIDAVLFTHHHVDHIFGMDDLRQINQRLDKFIDVYGNDNTMNELSITYRYAFNAELIKYKFVPLINIHRIPSLPFKYKNTEIIPIEIFHGNLKIYGYRIGKFAYITDCSEIPEGEFSKLEGLDILILNALKYKWHPTHFNLERAVFNAQKIKAKQTYLTHATHYFKHDKVNSELPENIRMGYDGLEINL